MKRDARSLEQVIRDEGCVLYRIRLGSGERRYVVMPNTSVVPILEAFRRSRTYSRLDDVKKDFNWDWARSIYPGAFRRLRPRLREHSFARAS